MFCLKNLNFRFREQPPALMHLLLDPILGLHPLTPQVSKSQPLISTQPLDSFHLPFNCSHGFNSSKNKLPPLISSTNSPQDILLDRNSSTVNRSPPFTLNNDTNIPSSSSLGFQASPVHTPLNTHPSPVHTPLNTNPSLDNLSKNIHPM